ncbi:MAG TPA: hypothetical protein VF198_00530 [Vicinamibacterales bacterium]
MNTWRNKHGGIVATGFSVDDVCWMHWPYLAAYRFTPREPDCIVAFPQAGAPEHIIRDTYFRSVVPMALQAFGYEALHASAVLMPGGVVGFFAASETGKSTMAFGLSERGFPQWGDDSLLFEPLTSPLTSLRLPFEVRLRPESSAFFESRGEASWEPLPASLPQRAPLAALCLLTRADPEERKPAVVRRLDPVRAFSSLIAHAHCFNPHDEARRATMLRHYMDVTGRLPIFEVVFRPVLDDMPRVQDAVLEALGPVAVQDAAARMA